MKYPIAGLVAVCLLVSACSSTQQPPPATVAAAEQPLCIVGRTVLPMSSSECQQRQQQERASQGAASNLLNRIAVKYESDALEVDLLEGIALGAHYKYRVEPSYRDNYFTRIDAYTFGRDFNPASLLEGLPLGLGMSRNSEVLFAQQFASGATARDPRSTYLPTRLPATPERALALKTGDYVRFNTRLGLLANAGQVWPLAGFMLQAKAGLAVLVEGEYQVHFFRLDGARVRLRLVAERARQRSGRAALKVAPVVKTALVNRIDNRLEPLVRFAGLDAQVSVAASKSRSNLFIVDYTLDLSNPEVADAYSQVFQPRITLSDLRIANPLRGQFDLQDRLLGSIEALDLLARADAGNGGQRVRRHFKGSNHAATRGVDFKVKLSRFAVNRSRLYRENFLTRTNLHADGSENTDHFLLPVWSQFRQRSMLFGMLDENQERSADALFLSNRQGEPVRFMNIGFALESKDRRLRPSEYRRLRRKIELLLNDAAEAELEQLLRGTRWLDDGYRRNLAVSLDYFFRESAFDNLVAAGYGAVPPLRDALTDFILQGIRDREFPLYTGSAESLADGNSPGAAVYRRWREPIEHVAEQLALAFNSADDEEKRMRAVLQLRNNSFYQRVGTAFWVYMMDRAAINVSEHMYLSLRLTADDHQGIEFSYGETGERQLYESVKLIQSLLNNRSLDMREPGDLDTVISRMTVVGN